MRGRYASGVAACISALLLSSCTPPGQATSFGYPQRPPVPTGATLMATAEGSDDDDPMRGRELLIDVGSADSRSLFDFYRERFPESGGWTEEQPASTPSLCLVNRESSDYDEFVEVVPYRGSAHDAGPHRFLVWTSRLHVRSNPNESPRNRCGFSGIWFPLAP